MMLDGNSVNQRFSSGPDVMNVGSFFDGRGKNVIDPDAVMRPIDVVPGAVNQRAPSGPAVIPSGNVPGGSWNSVTTCATRRDRNAKEKSAATTPLLSHSADREG
jgi:hypothetical protein